MKFLIALLLASAARAQSIISIQPLPTYPPPNWTAYPNTGYASVTGNSTGCTVNRMRATNDSSWISCARTGTGTYSLTFLSGFFTINPPICLVTIYGSPLMGYATDPTISGTTVTIVTLLNIGADGTFAISCR